MAGATHTSHLAGRTARRTFVVGGGFGAKERRSSKRSPRPRAKPPARSGGRPGRLHHRLPAVHERLLERYDQRAPGDDEGHVEDEALGSLVGHHRPARRQGHADHGGGDYRERDEGPASTLRRCARTILAPARAVKDDRSTSRSVGSASTPVSLLATNSPTFPAPDRRSRRRLPPRAPAPAATARAHSRMCSSPLWDSAVPLPTYDYTLASTRRTTSLGRGRRCYDHGEH